VTVQRDHGERRRYLRGPDEDEIPGRGCRCRRCCAANTAYGNLQARRKAYGQWHPFVDARRARDHIAFLREHGIGPDRIANLAGLPPSVMTSLLYGPASRPPVRRIRPDTEEKILAVQPGLDALAGRALVDATGTQRRVQSLIANGWAEAVLCRRQGFSATTLCKVLVRPQVSAATARKIRDLYNELWDVPPPQSTPAERHTASLARNRAHRNGWPPPMAWDDNQIDDPAAHPADGWQRPKRLASADLAAEAAEVIAWTGVSRNVAAERLGVTRHALEKAIARSGRAS
jgi:hypothetical protein